MAHKVGDVDPTLQAAVDRAAKAMTDGAATITAQKAQIKQNMTAAEVAAVVGKLTDAATALENAGNALA